MKMEVLFRGKRIDSGEWIYGSLISRPFGYSENQKEYSAIIIFDKHDESHFDGYLELEVIPETVGQFTGLTDKNGTKIFEGDIVQGFFEPDEVEDNIFLSLNIDEISKGEILFLVEDIFFFYSQPIPEILEITGNIHNTLYGT